MEYKQIFEWNIKTISLFCFLLILPNILGMLNLSTSWGFKIHFFQIAIILSALIYGPAGGFISGIVGSVYSAFLVNNPYLIVGNAILGLLIGVFFRYGFSVIVSVLLAFVFQLPWLILTDYYLVHLPFKVIISIVLALFISNMIWAVVSKYSFKHLRNMIE